MTTSERTLDELVELFRARDLCEAHVIRMALEEAGIRAAVEGEFLQGALGDVPVGWTTSPRVMVQASQVEAARKLVTQSSASSDSPNTLESVAAGVGVVALTAANPMLLVAAGTVAAVADRLSPRQPEAVVENPTEETCCLACGLAMGESDTCLACGWSYQCQEPAELVV